MFEINYVIGGVVTLHYVILSINMTHYFFIFHSLITFFVPDMILTLL